MPRTSSPCLCVSVVSILLGLTIAGTACAESTRAAIRGDGTLLVDGKPVFPIGVRSEKLHEIEAVAACGFNLILGSGEWTDAHYALARKHDLLVMGGHHIWATFKGTQAGIDPLLLEEEGGVQDLAAKAKDQSRRTIMETVRAFDHLPGVIGWKIADEPRGALVQVVTHGYEIFKSHNPQHLVAIMTDKQEWAPAFKNACDIMLLDLFALRGTAYKHRQASSLSDVYQRISACADVMNEKAVWYMPQLYPPSHWRPFNTAEELTLGDMRLQVYVGLLAGARGIVFYHWGVIDKARRPLLPGPHGEWVAVDAATVARRTEIVTAVVTELHALSTVLCNGRPNSDPYLRWIAPGRNGPGPQYTRAIEHDGKQYLMAVNLLDQPITARVYGRNVDSHVRAYDAAVFAGQSDLTVALADTGEPELTVGPRGAGVFLLTRRPIADL